MKRKVVALGLAAVLCLSASLTAFAAESSTTNNNSGNQQQSTSAQQESTSTSAPASTSTARPSSTAVAQTVEAARPGQSVAPQAVTVAIAAPNGTVSAVSLDTVIEQKTSSIVASIAAITASADTQTSAAVAVQDILTSPVSEQFTRTVEALAAIKGSDIAVNNCGTVKTAATARDAFGNTIASAGVIRNVTSGALIMLMSVNADGTVEYVEGIVDPVTGQVIGAFQGTPSVITVLVLA